MAMVIPSLLYSSETWTLTGTNETRIQTAEMKVLRRIAGCTSRDGMRTAEIRE